MSDLHKLVPRERKANLRYRLKIRKRAQNDGAYRKSVLAACKQDFLFWATCFGVLYEPRSEEKELPFIPWTSQLALFDAIEKWWGKEDIGAEKARGEGVSWIMCAMKPTHSLIFSPMESVGVVSKDELAADDPKNPDSIGWKVDFLLSKMPKWMVPDGTIDRSETRHTWFNRRNRASLAMFACSQDVGSGGRKTVFILDELSKFPSGKDSAAVTAIQANTECRIYIGTPRGMDNEYYRVLHEESNLNKITLDWRENEARNRGLYRMENGVPVAVDAENNPLPPEYDPPDEKIKARLNRLWRKGYTMDGRIRSPWYDYQCDRSGATPQRIAQELDRDYGGSVSRVYGEEFQQKAQSMRREPYHRGTFVVDSELMRGRFNETPGGEVLLWTQLNASGQPAKRPYAMGCDLAWGTGGAQANNSCVQIIDLVTMEQVLEYATSTVRPEKFADIVMAMGKWFHNAFLSWEVQGPGGVFGKRILERGYSNVYLRTVDELSTTKRTRKTQKVGFSSQNQEIRSGMFEGLLMAVMDDALQIRSSSLVAETGHYIYDGIDGKIVHSPSQRSDDGADKGKSHGDRVVAMGVALVAANDSMSNRPTEVKGEITEVERPDTWAARDRYHEALKRENMDDWDTRDNWELAGGRGW